MHVSIYRREIHTHTHYYWHPPGVSSQRSLASSLDTGGRVDRGFELTARAVVKALVDEGVTSEAKVAAASRAPQPHSLRSLPPNPRSAPAAPALGHIRWHLAEDGDGEEVVVGTSEVRRGDEVEAADGALGRKLFRSSVAPRANVFAARDARAKGADGSLALGGEPHLHERCARGRRQRRRGWAEPLQKLSKVLLSHGNEKISASLLRDMLEEVELCGDRDDRAPNLVFATLCHRREHIARIAA
mmetsp:Transcript_15022/g.49265  ORF Transcript_15022/g.49265 Transcript_15022/m.49265 type:complete len:244 (-) Transcript_15022:400-1131(-)